MATYKVPIILKRSKSAPAILTPNKLKMAIEEQKNTENEQFQIIEKSEITDSQANLCVGCGRDMGPNNQRQYCRKTYCEYET